jgi:plasmid stability protein
VNIADVFKRIAEIRAARHADPFSAEERAVLREANVEAAALRRRRCQRRRRLVSQRREVKP